MAELEQAVAELTMQTEYQLRLKDLHLQERVKELTGVCKVRLCVCVCMCVCFPLCVGIAAPE